jgi:hypothetical protein
MKVSRGEKVWMAIRSYIEPHKYGLRQSIMALFARLLRRETKFKIFFYADELPSKEVSDLLIGIVNSMGGTRQEDGRFLISAKLTSLRDLSVDMSQGLAPSSGTVISCQGKRVFVNHISQILKQERRQRRHGGIRRTSLVNVGRGFWARS